MRLKNLSPYQSSQKQRVEREHFRSSRIWAGLTVPLCFPHHNTVWPNPLCLSQRATYPFQGICCKTEPDFWNSSFFILFPKRASERSSLKIQHKLPTLGLSNNQSQNANATHNPGCPHRVQSQALNKERQLQTTPRPSAYSQKSEF
jgi:hypothetical protein